MGLSVNDLDQPLDDIAFLARSNHRIDVLGELVDGDRTRRELREATGVSRPTLGRMLAGFEERGWVREVGREYSLTPLGSTVAGEFADLMATVETTQQLRDLAPALPLASMDFDLRCLAGADITTPSSTDATAHMRRESQLLAESDEIRFLCNQAQPETVERYRDWVVEEGGSLEAVIAGDAIDAASDDPSMAAHVGDLVTAPGATIYRYDGPVSVMLGTYDDLAGIVPLDDSGMPTAFIESDHDAVRSWVRDTIAARRAEAVEVTPELMDH